VNTSERVLGWDLLRGLCAVAVASYHLLSWQDVATLHAWGSYGVYLFFILSGASLAYTYAPRLRAGTFRFGSFLGVRWMRLAPLYLLLMLLVVPWKAQRVGWGLELLQQVLLNATFLYGFTDPATSALLVGGWSLGIEAIFYLLFPLLLVAALRPRVGLALFLALLAVQAGWILLTVGSATGYEANAVRYHQAPAFAGWFMGGCLLGVARRSAVSRWNASTGVALVVAGFALMALVNPDRQGGELLGWRGVLLTAVCFGLVAASGRLRWDGMPARLAAWFGDATYGVYLLHPVLFFGLTFVVFPRLGVADPVGWSLPARCLFAAALLGVAFVLALASERWFERPLRDWSRQRAARRVTATP
jgi:exopolysaccharide production protein ExoZ